MCAAGLALAARTVRMRGGRVADLFELTELASFMQADDLDASTAGLARDLVTAEVRQEVGRDRFDALPPEDLLALKGVALEVAKRAILNPSGLRQQQIDDYSETYATETVSGDLLSDGDRRRIHRMLGDPLGGAFTIRSAAQPSCWAPSRLC